MSDACIVIPLFVTVNCGDPTPPFDGNIQPHNSTTVGARVNVIYTCKNGQQTIEEKVCTLDGDWESLSTNNSRICDIG